MCFHFFYLVIYVDCIFCIFGAENQQPTCVSSTTTTLVAAVAPSFPDETTLKERNTPSKQNSKAYLYLASRDFASFSVFQCILKSHKSVFKCFLQSLKKQDLKVPWDITFHIWSKKCFLPYFHPALLLSRHPTFPLHPTLQVSSMESRLRKLAFYWSKVEM